METSPAYPVGGTSPEVLQHYLTAGILIRNTRFYTVAECPLERKLELNSLHPEGLLFESMWKWEYADSLPVLSPFSQLCQPSADGLAYAVLAVWEVFGRPEIDLSKALAIPQKGHYADYNHFTRIAVQMRSNSTGAWIELTDNGEWIFYGFDKQQLPFSSLRAYDYLRSQHFAVGLEPHQYIEKEPAFTPTKREGAGRE